MVRLQKLDEVANLYNKTKDPKYKDQWYKLVKELADGIDYTNRRVVSFSSRRKRNVQGLNFSKKSYVNLL
jgi:hypothetical protein